MWALFLTPLLVLDKVLAVEWIRNPRSQISAVDINPIEVSPNAEWILATFYIDAPVVDFEEITNVLKSTKIIATLTTFPEIHALNRAKIHYDAYNDKVNERLDPEQQSKWLSIFPRAFHDWWAHLRAKHISSPKTFSALKNSARQFIGKQWNRIKNQESSEEIYWNIQKNDYILSKNEWALVPVDETTCPGGLCFNLRIRSAVLDKLKRSDNSIYDTARFLIVSEFSHQLRGINYEYYAIGNTIKDRSNENNMVSKQAFDQTIKMTFLSFFFHADRQYSVKTLTYRNRFKTKIIGSNEQFELHMEQKQLALGYEIEVGFLVLDHHHRRLKSNLIKMFVMEPLSQVFFKGPHHISVHNGNVQLFFYQDFKSRHLNDYLEEKKLSCGAFAQKEVFREKSPSLITWEYLINNPKCNNQGIIDTLGVAAANQNWAEGFDLIEDHMSEKAKLFASIKLAEHEENQQNSSSETDQTDSEDMSCSSSDMKDLNMYSNDYFLAEICVQSDSCSMKSPDKFFLPFNMIDFQEKLHGETKLMRSAYSGDLETVRYLLNLGANPYLKASDGYDAISLVNIILRFTPGNEYSSDEKAAFEEIYDLLYQFSRPMKIPKSLKTLSHESAKIGRTSVVRALALSGLDVFNVEDLDSNGDTILVKAVRHGHSSLVDMLLKRFNYVNSPDAFHMSPLMWAISFDKYYSSGVISYARMDLFNYQKIRNQILEKANKESITIISPENVFVNAIAMKRRDVYDLLLSKGVLPNSRDNDGKSALLLAAEHGQIDLLEKLFPLPGVRVNLADNHGFSPLMYAAKNGDMKVLERLLKFITHPYKSMRLDLNQQHPYTKRTAWMLASINGHKKFIEYALSNFPNFLNLELIDFQGNSLLHHVMINFEDFELWNKVTTLSMSKKIKTQRIFLQVIRERKCETAFQWFRSLDSTIQLLMAKKKDEFGFTLLHMSITYRCEQLAKFLISDKGLRSDNSIISAQTFEGLSPLMHAVRETSNFYKDILKEAESRRILTDMLLLKSGDGKTVLNIKTSDEIRNALNEKYGDLDVSEISNLENRIPDEADQMTLQQFKDYRKKFGDSELSSFVIEKMQLPSIERNYAEDANEETEFDGLKFTAAAVVVGGVCAAAGCAAVVFAAPVVAPMAAIGAGVYAGAGCVGGLIGGALPTIGIPFKFFRKLKQKKKKD